MDKKKIMITGAGGGFGLLITKALLEAGHIVVGTMRDVSGRNKDNTTKLKAVGATVLEMDVTSDASVEKGVATAIQEVSGLDVLINNAGVGVLGVQETFTASDLQKLFDINVFGVHRVTRAVMPHMRGKKIGLVINISSLLGRIAVPFYGPYNASKWALEALSENYRIESSQAGVDVCIVEPGGYPTSFIDNLVRPSDKERISALKEMSETAEGFLKGFEQALAGNPAQDPKNVATAIANLVAAAPGTRPFRTIVDNMGMGGPLEGYNKQLADITAGIFANFGIAHLLQLKTQ
ncbi:MAG: SDR family oxidoreductase [Leptospiraceae bacterium]|nr:SDR family oxidoreductase [Leptospiraceae bacterium]